jgi:heat shock protein HslJ
MHVRRRILMGAMVGAALCAAGGADAARRGPAGQPPSDKPAGVTKNFPMSATWRLVDFNGKPVPAGLEATLSIDSALRGSGISGCNTWSAAMYPIANQRLAVGPIATTKKACPPAIMAFERNYLVAIHASPSWDEVGGYLVLKSPAGTLRFTRGL